MTLDTVQIYWHSELEAWVYDVPGQGCAKAADLIAHPPRGAETTFVEPEFVWHYDCPQAVRDEHDGGIVHPQMRLSRSLDDSAGHKRVYRCERCGMLADVNFAPSRGAETDCAHEVDDGERYCRKCGRDFFTDTGWRRANACGAETGDR